MTFPQNPAIEPVNPNRACGIFPGQSMFQVSNASNIRGGLLDARQNFVGIINNILGQIPATIDRAAGISSLNRAQTVTVGYDSSTELIPNLIWYRVDNSYGIELPLPYQYASDNGEYYRVFSSTERNKILTIPAIIAAIKENQKIRVWVDTTNSSTPAWSIWQVNNTIANEYISVIPFGQDIGTVLVEEADNIFEIAKAFDLYVDNYNALVALKGTIENNTLVYVNLDGRADGFWSINQYNSSNSTFNVVQAQAYRTSDFYSTIDWYAQNVTISGVVQSYSATNYPMVTYTTESARNLAEGSSPTNTFVEIDDGINPWYWTAYDTTSSAWITVALENGTIELSSNFYSTTTTVYNPLSPVLTNVSNRDGSWEIRVLADILFYDGLLENIEINETFFSVLNFIHVQQPDVDWAFKTNFMTVAGYQIPLIQSGIQTTDISSSLQSYIEEVKPYRVKIRNFEQQYSPPIDQANIHVTDFDKPVYYDPVLKAYRRLDPTVAADIAILSSTLPWQDWYNNYTLNPNQIRKLNTTILFDRVTGYKTEFGGAYGNQLDKYDSYDGTALDRILNFYKPLPGMPLADPANLMSLNFKGTRTDGGLMTQFTDAASDFDNTETGFDSVGFDIQVNSGLSQIVDGGTLPGPSSTTYQLNAISSTDPLGYGLRDPYVGPQHPEERIPIVSDDVINLRMTSLSTPGAAPQTTKYFDVSSYSSNTVELYHGAFAANSNSILVWRDGLKLTSDQYDIDFLGRTVTVNIMNGDGSNATSMVVKIFDIGVGNGDSIIETDYYAGNNSNFFTINTTNLQSKQLLVSINGQFYDNSSITVSGNTLTLPVITETTDDIAINVFQTDADNNSNILQQETLPYNSNQTWTLNYPDNISVPSHVGTIVEVNGQRLLPPLTYYGPFDTTRQFLDFDVTIAQNTAIEIYVNGTFYPYAIPTATAGNSNLPFGVVIPNGQMPVNGDGQFAIYGQQLISLPFTQTNTITTATNTIIVDASGYTEVFLNGNLLGLNRDYTISVTNNISTITFMNTLAVNDVVNISIIFNFAEVCLVIHQNNDFEIANSVLTILKSLQSTDTILVTTFSNPQFMDIKTHTFLTNSSGEYEMYSPFGPDYTWITLNGNILVGDVNYGFSNLPSSIDNGSNIRTKLTLPLQYDLIENQWIVASVFTLQPARERIDWITTTALPAAQRMIPQPDNGGFGMMPLDVVGFDKQVDWSLIIPPDAKLDVFGNPVPVPLYNMADMAWENLRADPLIGGILTNPLYPTDTEIVVTLYDSNYSSKIAPTNPFYVPEIPPYFYVGNFIGDGTTSTFVVPEIGTISVVVAGTQLVFGTDYLISTTSSTTTIAFTIAPVLDADIAINVTKITSQVPGVVYIHGERIEYWNIEYSGSTATFSNIRRGTRGTSSCSEQRTVSNFVANGAGPFTVNSVGDLDVYKIEQAQNMNFVGDGTTTAFVISNLTVEAIASIIVKLNNVVVSGYTVGYPGINNISINFNNTPVLNTSINISVDYYVWLVEQFNFNGNLIGDFTLTTNSNSTQITFLESQTNTEIFVGVTTGNYVPAGVFVRNGNQDFDLPVPYDQTSGNRNIQPIQYIIEG